MGITMKDGGLQCSIFDGENPLKITKPLRLIELFAGIGAQAKALENLGLNFEHYRICEFDKYAVASYNAIHGTEFTTSDITKIHADDLGIVETDKYEYIMTYSFPCTDLSTAGKQKGMSRESGTRSSLLWEVERLLKETKQLPQLLLMENVPGVLSEKNRKDFYSWCDSLEKLGYTSKYAILNSKDYGVPQNRERCFMLSWLGEEFFYDFPDKIPLSIRLKDVLEKKVDEKYYLFDKGVKYISKRLGKYCQLCDRETEFVKAALTARGNSNWTGNFVSEKGISKTITTRAGRRMDDNFIKCEPIALDEQNGYLRKDGTIGTLTTDGSSPKHNNRVVEPNRRVRKLTPKECWRLMGFDDESFSRAEKVVSNSQLYKQAGNSIVVNVLMAIFEKLF